MSCPPTTTTTHENDSEHRQASQPRKPPAHRRGEKGLDIHVRLEQVEIVPVFPEAYSEQEITNKHDRRGRTFERSYYGRDDDCDEENGHEND